MEITTEEFLPLSEGAKSVRVYEEETIVDNEGQNRWGYCRLDSAFAAFGTKFWEAA